MFYRVMKGIIPVCCKFTQLHFRQILLKSVNILLSYCEKQKGELFLKHSVFNFICCSIEQQPHKKKKKQLKQVKHRGVSYLFL